MNVAQKTRSQMPEAITHQDELLTIDTNVSKFLEGLLHPGIKDQNAKDMQYITAPVPTPAVKR